MQKEAKKQAKLTHWVKGKDGKELTEKEQALIENESEIKFYGPKSANGWMSNFYPSPFMVGKIRYPTNEHYFQSKKYEGHPQEQMVINAPTPAQAFKLGRNKNFPRLVNWEEVKEKAMMDGLRLKFKTHHDLRQKLLNTGHKTLIEHTFKDRYWADGGDGSGKNRLGILLMQLREELRKK